MSTLNMHDELFIEMLSPQEHGLLDHEKVAEERRYFVNTPLISSKVAATMELTELYRQAGCYDEAVAVCQEALADLRFEEYRAYLLFRMGQVNEHKRDFGAALSCYLQSIVAGGAGRSLEYWQHNNAAFCYAYKQDFVSAEKHCQIALDIDERNWMEYGRRFLDHRNWNVWKNMGVVMEHTGRLKAAAAFYTMAVKQAPRCERAILHLRRLLERHPELAKEWKEPVEDLLTYYDVKI